MIENLYAAYVNLEHRKDRLIHMGAQLKRAGITADRVRGMLPGEYKGPESAVAIMRARTPGAIGCHFSQVKIMDQAMILDKHALVMEDDLVFCKDFQIRLQIINEFCDHNEWDIIWLGGTFHVGPPWWHNGNNIGISNLGRDAEYNSDHPRIIRTYGCFSTFAYIVNQKSLNRVLQLLNNYIQDSIGIDWLMIKIQDRLKTYAFVPGCVRQMDNKSDIGQGYTIFSGFEKLNGTKENSRYWYQDYMNDFDPLTFNWKECFQKKHIL